MNMELETNTNYRKIPRAVMGKLTMEETCLYACLCFKADFISGMSHVLRKTLCGMAGIKKEDTVTKYTNKLQQLGFIEKSNAQDKEKTLAIYHVHIPEKDWIRIGEGLLEEEIEPKMKGFLILVKCLCLNNTNHTLYNKTEMAEKLNIDRKTFNKYLDKAIASGRITEEGKGYRVWDEFVMEDYPKARYYDKAIKENYDAIVNYCKEKGCIPPPYNEKLMQRLVEFRYSLPKEEVGFFDFTEDGRKKYTYYSLEYNLRKHCPSLPERITSLNYFLKALIQIKYYYKYLKEGVFDKKEKMKENRFY